METKKIAVTGLVRRKGDEGKPVFAILQGGGIVHVGFTSSGWKEYEIPSTTVAVAFPLWGNRDATIFVHEPQDGMPERGTVASWEFKRGFAEALAQLLGVPLQSQAVVELQKRVARFLR